MLSYTQRQQSNSLSYWTDKPWFVLTVTKDITKGGKFAFPGIDQDTNLHTAGITMNCPVAVEATELRFDIHFDTRTNQFGNLLSWHAAAVFCRAKELHLENLGVLTIFRIQ